MVWRRMLRIIGSREEDKLQCLQDPGEANGDNLNNIRHEASSSIRNKKREYLKDRINELATNSKNKNSRDHMEEYMNFRSCINIEVT
jgi:hypothetical protein